jgi:hypothetical protein
MIGRLGPHKRVAIGAIMEGHMRCCRSWAAGKSLEFHRGSCRMDRSSRGVAGHTRCHPLLVPWPPLFPAVRIEDLLQPAEASTTKRNMGGAAHISCQGSWSAGRVLMRNWRVAAVVGPR